MTTEKKLCASIMLCQMTAILSGVSLLYLAVIVIIPSKNELELGISTIPIMCTTVKAEDIALKEASGDQKEECTWTTCGEWCLSKSTAICMQIHVAARSNGSKVTFHDCVDVFDKQCSALDVNITQAYKCKKGQCAELVGVFNCTRTGDNICRQIDAAYSCDGYTTNGTSLICEDECEERLHGVYKCFEKGKCNKIEGVQSYSKDCHRKCVDLRMKERNTVIFSKERLITSSCDRVSSSSATVDNNTIELMNGNPGWKNKEKVVFVFCTYYKQQNGDTYYDLILEDCFNATIGEASIVENITDYVDLLNYHKELTGRPNAELLINIEESLGLMNVTQLRINAQGCSNTLTKECEKFFKTHATDGTDGRTADRFPCYFTEKNTSFVVGVYNPKMLYIFLVLACAVPGSLFVFACFVLFLCSKTVGVNDEGHLFLTLFKGSGSGVAKEPVQFDELL